MKTTIKKVDLAESVKNALATTKSAGMEAVETVFTEIAKALAEGNTVEISGFGKFEVTERSARTGINPATKEKIEIPASKSVKFKPSKALSSKITIQMPCSELGIFSFLASKKGIWKNAICLLLN